MRPEKAFLVFLSALAAAIFLAVPASGANFAATRTGMITIAVVVPEQPPTLDVPAVEKPVETIDSAPSQAPTSEVSKPTGTSAPALPTPTEETPAPAPIEVNQPTGDASEPTP